MIGITIDYRCLQKSLIIAFCLFFLACPLPVQAALSTEQQALFDELLARAEEELPEDAIPEGIRSIEDLETFLTEQAVENLEDFVPEELNTLLEGIGNLEDLGNVENLDSFLGTLGDIEGIETIDDLRDLANLGDLENILSNIENLEGIESLADLGGLGEILGGIEGIENLADLSDLGDILEGVTDIDALRALGELGELGELGDILGDIQEFTDLEKLTDLGEILGGIEGLEGLESLADLGELGNILGDIEGIEDIADLAGLGEVLGNIESLEDIAGIAGLEDFLGDLGSIESLADLGGLGDLAELGELGDLGGVLDGLLNGEGIGGVAGNIGGGLAGLFGGGLGGGCDGPCFSCGICQPIITNTHEGIRENTEREWNAYRRWFVEEFFFAAQIPDAMMLMAEQLTAVGIQQIQIIGTFFDAKHQLETQRLFQTLTAQAHKDYHPSEELCEIGTGTKSLAASERISNLGQLTFANRMMQRQLLSRDVLSGKGEISDRESRIKQFREVFCNPNDNGAHLQGEDSLCGNGGIQERYNLDVDYTSALESKLTLDLGFGRKAAASADEGNIYALGANLFGHQTLNVVADRVLATTNHRPKELAYFYLRQRAVAAKRSVAQNSYAALTSMRASGNNESAPFLKAVIRELGVAEEHINPYIGESPSYFAQMEVLTKKLYQNPKFYAGLYDKPANVERRGAALQAIALMQDRDIYKSLLRSEAVLATLLETLIRKEHDRISRDLATLRQEGEALPP